MPGLATNGREAARWVVCLGVETSIVDGSFSRLALSEIALALRRAKCWPERAGARQACGIAQCPERIWRDTSYDHTWLQCDRETPRMSLAATTPRHIAISLQALFVPNRDADEEQRIIEPAWCEMCMTAGSTLLHLREVARAKTMSRPRRSRAIKKEMPRVALRGKLHNYPIY
jgi:hypothetical protein